jgi:tetratricopeptide (TPR) repeat protein
VELDYPTPAKKKKQSAELQKQNEELLKQYKVQGYPTILVMDAEGKVVAKTGYQQGGPEKYVKHLAKFVEVHGDVVKMTKELDKAQGLDRAKLLDKLIDGYIALNNEIDDLPAWDKEIVKLDADNKAGLKAKHEFRILMAEFSELKNNRKVAEAKAVADKMLALQGVSGEQQLEVYLALCEMYRENGPIAEAKAAAEKALAVPGISGEKKQDVYMAQCECYFAQGDFVNVLACLKKGIEAAPESEKVGQFKGIIEQFKPMAEAQEAIVKLKAELANLKGLDRAKTLDKLIEAWDKLGGRSSEVSSQDIDKWSREIMTLDADNKAGLQKKYAFRNQMADGTKLLQEKKTAEGRAAIEKALTLPGATGEQTQTAHFKLAISYLQEGDPQKGLEHLQKALDAAPDTQRAQMIKGFIARIKQQMEADKPSKK